jgi:hypothetical protein
MSDYLGATMFEPPTKIGVVVDPTYGAGAAVLWSNLERYGYDMVVATTQRSINQGLRGLLQSQTLGPFVMAFKTNANNQTVIMDVDSIQNRVGPLSGMPDKANKSDQRVVTLSYMGFDSAFFGEFGLPPGVDEKKLDLVTFDQGTSRVTYHLFFKSLTVCTLRAFGNFLVWQKITQPPDQPWVFRLNVDLDMRAGDVNAFNLLPENVKERIKNLSPNSAFSLTQLMLDLNSASLQDSPAIEGLDPNSPVCETLMRIMFTNYWQPQRESGRVMLGYGVVPTNPNKATPSIVPTDLNIVLSANRDGQGNETHNYGLYTLNYLVMSEGRRMPPPGQFSWNWLEEGDSPEGQSVGVAAINRATYANFLIELLRTNFAGSFGPAGFPPFDFSVQGRPDAPVTDDLIGLLDFRSEAILGEGYDVTIFGGAEVRGNVIRMDVRAVADNPPGLNLFYSGRVIDYYCAVEYVLQVDKSGILRTQIGATQFQNQSVSVFAQFEDQLNLPMALVNLEEAMNAILNGSHAWIFPGGSIVAYRNAAFSAWGDLIAYFYYQPLTN